MLKGPNSCINHLHWCYYGCGDKDLQFQLHRMGIVYQTVCYGKEIDKSEAILQYFVPQSDQNRHNSNDNEPKIGQNHTHDSMCNTNGHKSSLIQQPTQQQEQKIACPSISNSKQFMYEAPVLDPTITIDKDHPFFYRNYGTEIQKPAVRNTLKARLGIQKNEALSHIYNSNNNQKGKTRYLTQFSI